MKAHLRLSAFILPELEDHTLSSLAEAVRLKTEDLTLSMENRVSHLLSRSHAPHLYVIGRFARFAAGRGNRHDRHDELWAVQERMKFALTAYGIEGPMTETMAAVTTVVSARLASHREDRPL